MPAAWRCVCDFRAAYATPYPLEGLTAYINHVLLAELGLVPPVSITELCELMDYVQQYGEVGVAAENDKEFAVVFQVVDPAFTANDVALLVAVGDLNNFRETSDPFATGALFVVSDTLPSAYMQNYRVFTLN